MDGSSSYKGDYLVWLGMSFLTNGGIGKRLKFSTLREAITSGEFLDFDKSAGVHSVGPLQQAMLELHDQIEHLQAFDSSQISTVALSLLRNEQVKQHRNMQFPIPNQDLVMLFAAHDRIDNVIALCRAIHQALLGNTKPLTSLDLNPSSPLEGESEKIRKERPGLEAVNTWLNQ